LYSGGHLMAFSALPVLTDQRMTLETDFGFRKGSCANQSVRASFARPMDARRSNVRCAPVLETTTI
ncbi:hypothetical protein, partial [Mesorhizobium sp.]|uniref:hypothetical protein n=1 Tax=Mesorhizobium sp. TaxID=1871066 RepID=UPI00257A5A66